MTNPPPSDPAGEQVLDPADKRKIDWADEGEDPDDTTKRRILKVPAAWEYSPTTLARWQRELSDEPDPGTPPPEAR